MLQILQFLDVASFDFTCLLHTYFSLPDVSKTTISGLGALKYIDKVKIKLPVPMLHSTLIGLYTQVDKGSTKEETEDPKTIDKFTDRFTTLLV